MLLQKRILIDNSATFTYYHCNELNNLIISSYQERWRDWPFEASAAGSYEYCAKSIKPMWFER
jgi:hypothetical protein